MPFHPRTAKKFEGSSKISIKYPWRMIVCLKVQSLNHINHQSSTFGWARIAKNAWNLGKLRQNAGKHPFNLTRQVRYPKRLLDWSEGAILQNIFRRFNLISSPNSKEIIFSKRNLNHIDRERNLVLESAGFEPYQS